MAPTDNDGHDRNETGPSVLQDTVTKPGLRPNFPVVAFEGYKKTIRALLQALQAGARIIVLAGDPGSGRTTILQTIAATARQNGRHCHPRQPGTPLDPACACDLVDDVCEADLRTLLSSDTTGPPRLLTIKPGLAALALALAPGCLVVPVPPLDRSDVEAILLRRCVQFGMLPDRFRADAVNRLAVACGGSPKQLDDLAGGAIRLQIAARVPQVTEEMVDLAVAELAGPASGASTPPPEALPDPEAATGHPSGCVPAISAETVASRPLAPQHRTDPSPSWQILHGLEAGQPGPASRSRPRRQSAAWAACFVLLLAELGAAGWSWQASNSASASAQQAMDWFRGALTSVSTAPSAPPPTQTATTDEAPAPVPAQQAITPVVAPSPPPLVSPQNRQLAEIGNVLAEIGQGRDARAIFLRAAELGSQAPPGIKGR